jgi:hypothetical protein
LRSLGPVCPEHHSAGFFALFASNSESDAKVLVETGVSVASQSVKRLNVKLPDHLHARLKGRAGLRGKTIQEYVTEAVEEIVTRDEAEDRKAGRG